MPRALGISGSVVRNSTTDGLVSIILEATEMETEFVKLVDNQIRPCKGCTVRLPEKGLVVPCQIGNECIIKDDWQEISAKMRAADAVVLGTNPTFFHINAETKKFMERGIALNHALAEDRTPLEGKLAASVVTCNTLADGNTVADYVDVWFEEMTMLTVGRMVTQGSWGCQDWYLCCVNRAKGEAVKRLGPPSWCEERIAVRETLNDSAVLERARKLGEKIRETYDIQHRTTYPTLHVPPEGIRLEDGGDRFGTTALSRRSQSRSGEETSE